MPSTIPSLVLAVSIVATHLSQDLIAQEAPKVVELRPAHGDMEVDARKTRQLTVKFDQKMDKRGRSICGGGPTFPKAQKIRWKDDFTLIIDVALVADHSYKMSLNCQSFRNFMSAKGVRLAPTAWNFTTLPAMLTPIKEQRALNKKAFSALKKLLAARYSYYDLRPIDWSKQYKLHQDKILERRTTVGWASAVATMLKPTQDLHLYLRIGDHFFGAGSRRVDALYRGRLLAKELKDVRQPIPGVVTGHTQDGISYLMISSWTRKIDFDKVERLIVKLRDDKKVKALVLDVRPNSGGDETLARRVARWFVAGNRVYAKNTSRIREGKKGFGPIMDRSIQGKDGGERFDRPVAVLMSHYCMSSNEAFLLMMKQAEDCTLIGQRSYGSSGNPKPHELPNGVTLFLPSWKALRPDGSCFEAEGIAPDVEVVPTSADLQKRDLILARAIEQLRQKK